jgi:hypothetical protein
VSYKLTHYARINFSYVKPLLQTDSKIFVSLDCQAKSVVLCQQYSLPSRNVYCLLWLIFPIFSIHTPCSLWITFSTVCPRKFFWYLLSYIPHLLATWDFLTYISQRLTTRVVPSSPELYSSSSAHMRFSELYLPTSDHMNCSEFSWVTFPIFCPHEIFWLTFPTV